jgi:mRNA-degrading endonuclease RelE of RelBE toxin-antitoxin system
MPDHCTPETEQLRAAYTAFNTRDIDAALALMTPDEAVGHLAAEPLPHGSQKLSGSERTYRIRVGDYRVIYEVFAESRIIEISAGASP